MAIEPLNSAMTYQSQLASKPIPTAQQGQESSVDRDINMHGTERIDKTTLIVENAQNSNKQNGTGAQGKEGTGNEQIKKAVEQMNKSMNKNMTNSEAVFGIHEGTNRVTIKIIDRDTKEVIKELPPEKTLDMIAKVWEMAGILVDERR
ncbi:MAG: flagellar protein FlaG [Lachnospiraceae bacterium]|nr:flagellar protein FlaG [Lachnospiraceae bacterium]